MFLEEEFIMSMFGPNRFMEMLPNGRVIIKDEAIPLTQDQIRVLTANPHIMNVADLSPELFKVEEVVVTESADEFDPNELQEYLTETMGGIAEALSEDMKNSDKISEAKRKLIEEITKNFFESQTFLIMDYAATVANAFKEGKAELAVGESEQVEPDEKPVKAEEPVKAEVTKPSGDRNELKRLSNIVYGLTKQVEQLTKQSKPEAEKPKPKPEADKEEPKPAAEKPKVEAEKPKPEAEKPEAEKPKQTGSNNKPQQNKVNEKPKNNPPKNGATNQKEGESQKAV